MNEEHNKAKQKTEQLSSPLSQVLKTYDFGSSPLSQALKTYDFGNFENCELNNEII